MDMDIDKEVRLALMSLLAHLYKNGFNDEMGGGVFSALYHTIFKFDNFLNFDRFLELCYRLNYIVPNGGEGPMSSILSQNNWMLSKRVKRLFKLNILLDDV